MFFGRPTTLVDEEDAIEGREGLAFEVPVKHEVLDADLLAEPKEGQEVAYFALGCFWGAERLFWQIPGVVSTAVGYMGGFTKFPTYEEVCTGMTGHAEVVRVVFDPKIVSFEELLRVFWEEHDPTQGMRQGNDVGTQYRSAVFTSTAEQARVLEESRDKYQAALNRAQKGQITTELVSAQTPITGVFYPAEAYHQQYLHKVPNGYCGLQGTGVTCPGA
jgi:peptide-methionine (S)-S-oxide reductase